jgi:hypothetical protein
MQIDMFRQVGIVLIFLLTVPLIPTASAYIELGLDEKQYHHSSRTGLYMDILVKHDEFLSDDATVEIYINNLKVRTLSLGDYLGDQANYTTKEFTFNYNLSVTGRNDWNDYPQQDFTYSASASGWCGTPSWASDECNLACYGTTEPTNPHYPCYWIHQSPPREASISGLEGLKFIKDIDDLIGIPDNTTVEWKAEILSNPNVEVTARSACGNEQYPTGIFLDPSGWNRFGKEIYGDTIKDKCQQVGTRAMCSNLEPFDELSVQSGYRKYGGPTFEGIPGGGVYEKSGSNYYYQVPVSLDGSMGEISFSPFDLEKTYVMFSLPPNGSENPESSRVCAYTDYSVPDSSGWVENLEVPLNTVSYGNDYVMQYSDDDIRYLLDYPDCPIPDQSECVQTVLDLNALETYDPYDAVTLYFYPLNKTVRATSDKLVFESGHTEVVSLSEGDVPLSNLDPSTEHTVTVRLNDDQGNILDQVSANFGICDDRDSDGYCEDGTICSDDDPFQWPGAIDVCDGEDNDCDGQVDEDFRDPEEKLSGRIPGLLGEGCYNWPQSACAGNWTCTADGQNLTCSGEYQPGERREICANYLDDDCDGEPDESFEDDGSQGCFFEDTCSPGETRPCGSNVGRCAEGYRICMNGEWGVCRDNIEPSTEVCNLGSILGRFGLPENADDDCNGIIDDTAEGKCRCTGGEDPVMEVCNIVDDDCDGRIDDGVQCCRSGETQFCGSDIGRCSRGVRVCISGAWDDNCQNAVESVDEICYNNEDDDCDNYVDEGCYAEITCENGIKDINENDVDCGDYCPIKCYNPISLMLLASGAMILILLLMAVQLRRVLKKKKEAE